MTSAGIAQQQSGASPIAQTQVSNPAPRSIPDLGGPPAPLDERLRMANAIMRGRSIDRFFVAICDQLDIDPERAFAAPLAAIATHQKGGRR
jgi:hypothetical protein